MRERAISFTFATPTDLPFASSSRMREESSGGCCRSRKSPVAPCGFLPGSVNRGHDGLVSAHSSVAVRCASFRKSATSTVFLELFRTSELAANSKDERKSSLKDSYLADTMKLYNCLTKVGISDEDADLIFIQLIDKETDFEDCIDLTA